MTSNLGRFYLVLSVSFTALYFTSCAGIRSMALKTAGPLFTDSMKGIEAEGNWEVFKDGTPGNLMFIDGLLSSRPNDRHLLVAAIKGNAGYAFGVSETLHLDNRLADNGNDFYKKQAISYYNKAFSYGIHFLKNHDVTLNRLEEALKDKEGIQGLLEKNLSSDEVTLQGVLFTAQSLGGMINLQRENIQLVSKLSLVKGMFDWVCGIDPEIAHGTCSIFYGSYEAGRPEALGGDPKQGEKIFLKFIERSPHNWLARVAYIEFYALTQYDEQAYLKQKKELEKYRRWLDEENNWFPQKEQREAFQDKQLRLYQAIAIKRFEIIKKHQKELF